MAQLFSEKAQAVIKFLQQNPVHDVTTHELAKATDIPLRSITGVLLGLEKKDILVRVKEKVGGETLTYVRLTPNGVSVDPYMEKVVL